VEKKDRILEYHQTDRQGPRLTFDVALFVFGMLAAMGLLAVLLVAVLLQFGRMP
jgi:hypothetical protein